MPQDFKKLQIWKESFDIAFDIYQSVIPKIPERDNYGGINSQLQGAVLSISNDIASGCGSENNQEFAHYLHKAVSGCKEVENLLLFVNKLGYINDDKHKELETRIINLGGKIYNFVKVVEAKGD